MLLTCEKCKTIFRIDATALGPVAQQVRCSVCTHVWKVTPRPTLPGTDNRMLKETAAKLKWPALIFLIIMFVSALVYGFRGPITASFPVLTASFNSAGLSVVPDISVLEIRNLQAAYQGRLLRVRGEIYNKDRFTAHAAGLDMKVISRDGSILAAEPILPDSRYIEAGQSAGFFIQLEVEGAADADVRVDLMPGALIAQ